MKKTYNEITHNEIISLSSDFIMGTSISYKVPHVYYVTAMSISKISQNHIIIGYSLYIIGSVFSNLMRVCDLV